MLPVMATKMVTIVHKGIGSRATVSESWFKSSLHKRGWILEADLKKPRPKPRPKPQGIKEKETEVKDG